MSRKLILLLIMVATAASCSGPASSQAGPTLLIPSTTFTRSIHGTLIISTQTPFLSPIPEITTVTPTTNPTLVQIFNSTFDPKTVLTRLAAKVPYTESRLEALSDRPERNNGQLFSLFSKDDGFSQCRR